MAAKQYPVIDLVATGRNITALRTARGLSVSDVQEFFGFEAPQAIYKWQKGQSLPTTENLYALATLLEVPIEDILIPMRSKFQVLPQDKTCGSGRFGENALLTSAPASFFFCCTVFLIPVPVSQDRPAKQYVFRNSTSAGLSLTSWPPISLSSR